MGRLFWIIIAIMALGLVALIATGDSGTLFGLDGDSFARTLYLGLLGAVVAGRWRARSPSGSSSS
jgi:aspartyl protease family protein